MKRTLGLFAIAALLATPAGAQEKLSRQDRRAMAMTVEQVADVVEIKGADDPLETIPWVSTRPFLKKSGGDKFLRAGIEKATGEIFFQLYLFAVSNRGAFRPNRLTYLRDGEVQSAAVDRINFDVNCYRGGCTHYEDAIATLPREAVEGFASCAAPGTDASFRMKVFGDTTEGVEIEMFCTEAAGLLLAVDRTVAAIEAAE